MSASALQCFLVEDPATLLPFTHAPAHTVRLISLTHVQSEPVGVEADSSLERS